MRLLVSIIVFLFASAAWAADTQIASSTFNAADIRGVCGPYWSDTSTAVFVYSDSLSDAHYIRTTDGGATWSGAAIENSTAVQTACWFDKETPGDTGALVHIVFLDSNADDANYLTINVGTGTVSSITQIEALGTVSATTQENRVAITKTVSGNLLVAGVTAGTLFADKSTNNGASWSSITDPWEDSAQYDWGLLFPAATADTNDAALIYWDISADELSVKMYDDSANTWTETAVGSSMVESTDRPNFDGAVRHSDGVIMLAAHSDEDSAGDDLLTWTIAPSSIASPTVTAKTALWSDTNQAGAAGVFINQQNNDVYVAYTYGTAFPDSTDISYKKSTDGMSSWGSEVDYSAAADDYRYVTGGRTVGNAGGRLQWAFYNDDLEAFYVNLDNDIEIAASGGPTPTPTPTPIGRPSDILLLGVGR